MIKLWGINISIHNTTTHKNEKKNIVLIVDDFHKIPQRFQIAIKKTEGYAGVVLIIDDIYDITSRDFAFSRFTIMPLKPTLRNELIGQNNWFSTWF